MQLVSCLEQLPATDARPGTVEERDGTQPALVLQAPPVLSIQDEYEAFLSLIYRFRYERYVVRRSKKDQRDRLVLQLDNVKRLDLDAALVITAEFHRLMAENPTARPFIDDAKWPLAIRSLLESLGFYNLVRSIGRTSARQASDVNESAIDQLRFVQFLSHTTVDGRAADRLMERLKEAGGRTPGRIAIYGAIVEAIKNALNHAYPEHSPPRVDPCRPRWWAAGSYEPTKRILRVAVYDTGVGIPYTLPRKRFIDQVLAFCPPEWRAADLIAGAIEFSRTATGLAHRGNGLWTICGLIDERPESSVRILSGQGDVTYSGPDNVRKTTRNTPFCGTLIVWTMMLPADAGIGERA